MITTIKAMNDNDLFITKVYTYALPSVAANSSAAVTSDMLGLSTPEGYTPIGFVHISPGNGHLQIATFNANASGSVNVVYLKNTHQSSAVNNATLSVRILYTRAGVIPN